jgi:tRNA nucleotidyltransferase (CCA-adding enzyme)
MFFPLSFITKLQNVFHKIGEYLRISLTPQQVVKVGSCAKGTNLRGRNEIDIVCFFNDFEANRKYFSEKLGKKN